MKNYRQTDIRHLNTGKYQRSLTVRHTEPHDSMMDVTFVWQEW